MMKKTLIALAVASTAFSVQAAEIYSSGGTTVEVYGQANVGLDKTKDTRFDLKNDESRLGFKVTQKVSPALSAIAGYELRFDDPDADATEVGNFTDPRTHKAYAGLKFNGVGTLTFGRQSTTIDDIALSEYGYGVNKGVVFLPKDGDRTIKFRIDEVHGFSLGADYSFKGSSDKDAAVKERLVTAGLFFNHDFNGVGFKLNGGYAQQVDGLDRPVATTGVNVTDKIVSNGFIVSTEVSYDRFAIAADYNQAKVENKDVAAVPDVKTHAYQVAVKYDFRDDVTGYARYNQKEVKIDDYKETSKTYGVGASYKLHKNVVTYAQFDRTEFKVDGDKENDNAVSLGLRVYF